MPFEITVNIHNLPSPTSSDSGDTDSSAGSSGGGCVDTGNNNNANVGSSQVLLSPTPHHQITPQIRGAPIQRKSPQQHVGGKVPRTE